MNSDMNKPSHQEIEAKWQQFWNEKQINITDILHAKKPYFNLMMFPYPSAEGLHVGNMYAFTGSDIYGRYMRMQGYDVFEPIGLDGFGIHSENFALKIGRHPKDHAAISEKNFYKQLHTIGASFDWSRTVETYNPNYYRWTQWLFTKMFEHGLAYRKTASVTWCGNCKTVLSDEQVVQKDGIDVCERCGNKIEKKLMEQWFFRITAYAGKLLENLSKLNWSEKVKVAQERWIGKKDGININYPLVTADGTQVGNVVCFTTRPETNFGATFVVMAPEYQYISNIINNVSEDVKKQIISYQETTNKKTEQERISEGRKKTGVNTGLYCLNQLTNTKMPLYISDFVLAGFGTGVVVGVPGHDTRDFEFAQAFHLPVKRVVTTERSILRSYLIGAEQITDQDLVALGITIVSTSATGSRRLEIPKERLSAYQQLIQDKLTPGYWNEVVGKDVWFLFKEKDGTVKTYILDEQNNEKIASLCSHFNGDSLKKTANIWAYLAENEWYTPYIIQEDEGIMINSGFLDGLDIHEATSKMMDYLEQKGWGKRVTTYHLRDWTISRQRYWGAPIPMIFCETCKKNGLGGHPSMPGWWAVPENQLPVLLPDIQDYKPRDDGVGPLAKHKEFYETSCPHCGLLARRETDVCDTFLDSSWYHLRYPTVGSTLADTVPFDKKITKKWLPVAMYTGGAEHSVLHLMYARFIAMALHDMGYIDFEEPYTTFFAHGLVIKDGAKMSKSKGNVVNPDEYIKKYGADSLRMYLMFMGPFSEGGDFRDTGMEGMYRFLGRVWRLITSSANRGSVDNDDVFHRQLHRALERLTHDIPKRRYNTAIAALMECVNAANNAGIVIGIEDAKVFTKMLAPFAPYIAEELWYRLHKTSHPISATYQSVHNEPWPMYDKSILINTSIQFVIQVNGKIRETCSVTPEEARDQKIIEALANKSEKLKKYLTTRPQKIIFISGKLINFVV